VTIGVRYDEESWRRGRAAGMTGGPEVCPPDLPDRLAYYSGYIEGKAPREQREEFRVVAERDPMTCIVTTDGI
jgi:hypothetical protein